MADWQQIVALIFTAMAGAYLLRRLRKQTEKSGSGTCGGCHSCGERSGSDSSESLPIVDVDTLAASSCRKTPKRS